MNATNICYALAIFCLLSGIIGLYRFRHDSLARIHALSLLETAGCGLVLLGLIAQCGLSVTGAKLILLFILLLIANPTATHAMAHTLWQRQHADKERL